jgi:hypothetical protein
MAAKWITGVSEVVPVNPAQASLRQCAGPDAGEVRPQRGDTSRVDEHPTAYALLGIVKAGLRPGGGRVSSLRCGPRRLRDR